MNWAQFTRFNMAKPCYIRQF